MLPTRERLDAVDDPAALHERYFRLVVRHELAARDAAAQILRIDLGAPVQQGRELRRELGGGERLLERPAHRKT